MHRRAFLGASAIALAPSLSRATQSGQTTSTSSAGNGRLVVIYDDAPVEDYETAFPVHRDLDVPGCVAPVSTWVGNKEGYCTVDQLSEMSTDGGFEVLSHTREHSLLTASDVVKDVVPEDTKVYPDVASHAYHPRYSVEITDGDRSVTRKIVRSGEDEDGVFMELDEPVGEAFDADNPDVVERYPPETMKYVLSNSQATLRHMGFRADNLIVPYDRFSPYVKKFAEQHYTAVGNAVGDTDGLNDPEDLDPFGLRRWYFIENGTRSERFHRLDTIARENRLAIFGAHTFKEEVTSERIREVLEGAIDRGIEIVTLREALQEAGVVDAPTTPVSTATGVNGTAARNDTITARTTPDGSTGEPNDGRIVPGASNETVGGMAVLAGIGATLSGWHFLKRD